MSLLVDFIIAVHDARRPIARAVQSVIGAGLDHETLRVTVVCHNLARDEIGGSLGPQLAGQVRLLELRDGIHSPAGPFNYGIDAADAEFVSIMGSDDWLDPGALRAWTHLAEERSLDVVIPVQRHPTRSIIRNPVVRFRRIAPLDPLRDRLVYRTTPIGLIRTDLVKRTGLRLTSGVATGEDQEFSLRLALSGARIGYAWGRPGYVLGDDAQDRTTQIRRTVEAEFEACLRMIKQDWFRDLPLAVRHAVAVKYTRIHVFSFIARRFDAADWGDHEREQVSELLTRLENAAPGYAAHLSLADAAALRALTDNAIPLSRVGTLASARRRFGTPRTIVPARLSAMFAADAPLRLMVGSLLLSL